MVAEVFVNGHDTDRNGEENFDYLIKIINLTPFGLECSKLVLEWGNMGSAYKFKTIEAFESFKCKIWKGTQNNNRDPNGAVKGVVRYTMVNTVFEIAFLNPKSGKNDILVEDTANYNDLDKGCVNRVSSATKYCGMERTHTLKQVYEGLDSNGVPIIKTEVRFENINNPIDKDKDTRTTVQKKKAKEMEIDASIKIPVIIRYGVTDKNAIAVVIIDIDREALAKNEKEIFDAKQAEYDLKIKPINIVIDNSKKEILALKKQIEKDTNPNVY